MSRKPGFTLTELLVVIAVIATIAAMLLPVFAQAREAAHQATCIANLHQLALAHQIYVEDYDGVLPSSWFQGPNGSVLWSEFLFPYFRDARLLDQGFNRAPDKVASSWLADYAMCAWGSGGNGTAALPYWRWPGAPSFEGGTLRPMTLAEVHRPAETMQFGDGLTTRFGCLLAWKHGNGVLNGAFLDGHAHRVSMAEFDRVERDA